MPELFVALQRNESRNSKSLTVPPFQMTNVFPIAGFSSVVSPRSTPSFTLHSRVSPSQPVKSRPLNSDRISPVSGGAFCGTSAADSFPTNARAVSNVKKRVISGLHRIHQALPLDFARNSLTH